MYHKFIVYRIPSSLRYFACQLLKYTQIYMGQHLDIDSYKRK